MKDRLYSFGPANCTYAGQSLSQSAEQRNTISVSHYMSVSRVDSKRTSRFDLWRYIRNVLSKHHCETSIANKQAR